MDARMIHRSTSNVKQVESPARVVRWKNKTRCYMAMICWIFGLNEFITYATVYLQYSLYGMVPIIILYSLFVVPLCYMEMALGQFSQCSYINIWKLSPPFKGIGLSCLLAFSVCSYGNNVKSIIMLNYLTNSLRNPIPWYGCSFSYAKDNCYILGDNSSWQMKCLLKSNSSYCKSMKLESSAAHYWSQVVSADVPFYSFTKISVDRMIHSAITSLVIYMIIRKGVKTLEFFVPYLVIVPHLLQFILFTIAFMLRGSNDHKLLKPHFQKLKLTSTWTEIITITLMGTNLGLGGSIMLGSEIGDFRAPIHMAAIGIYSFNFAVSLGFAIFCSKAISIYIYEANVPLDIISDVQSGVLFKYLTIGFKNWPLAPQFWCVLYFFALYVVNVRYKVLVIHAILSGIHELFPKSKRYSELYVFIIVLIDLCISVVYYDSKATNFYNQRMEMMDILSCIIVVYKMTAIICVYGINKVIDDIHFMLGFRPSAFWIACWHLLPLTGVVVFGISMWTVSENLVESFKKEELWYSVFVVTCWVTCLVLTPSYLVYYWYRRKPIKCQKLIKPSPLWGPADVYLRKSREMFSAHSMTKEYIYRQQRLTRRFETEDSI